MDATADTAVSGGCTMTYVEWRKRHCAQKTLEGQVEELTQWEEFDKTPIPEAVLAQFHTIRSPEEALMVARAFESCLGLVAICRWSTSCAGEPRTLMDEILAKNGRYIVEARKWKESNYLLLCEAFEQVGFKRSDECSTAELVDAYILDPDFGYCFKQMVEEHNWILNFEQLKDQLEELHRWKDFDTTPIPEAALAQFHTMRSPEEALAVAWAFESRLGLVAMCRFSTAHGRKPRTLMDAIIAEKEEYLTWSHVWEERSYTFLCEAFEQVGFKRSDACSPTDLVETYLDDARYRDMFKRHPEKHQWIVDCKFKATITGIEERKDFMLEARPDAVLQDFRYVRTPTHAMKIARAFECRLGLVAICRENTFRAGKPCTLMDAIHNKNGSFLMKDCEWGESAYALLREAFELAGFKRSMECNAADLVNAYLLDAVYREITKVQQPKWIIDFKAWQTMVTTLPAHLEELVRARSMRYRTRQHFINLDKVQYDYVEMRQNRSALHLEFTATYRFFSRLVAIRFATPVAIVVPFRHPNEWVKTHHL